MTHLSGSANSVDDLDLAARVDLEDAVRSAVRGAFYSWLDEFEGAPVGHIVEDAVQAAMKEWLDEQTPFLRDAIAEVVAQKIVEDRKVTH